MKVSVALAAFNGERYIKEQLQSVYEQSLTVDEVIICDDCSSDNTVLVAESFIREKNLHGSWHIYKNKENLGYAGNCAMESIFFYVTRMIFGFMIK